MSFEEGALLEPLSVAVHACRRAAIVPGRSCTIIGAGAIGLLCAAAARDAGCTTIAIADIVESRVAFALENGFADVGHVVATKKPRTTQESLESAKATAQTLNSLRLSSGKELQRTDYTFECTGVESCVQTAVYVCLQSKNPGDTTGSTNLCLGYEIRRQGDACWHGHAKPCHARFGSWCPRD